MGAPRFIHSLRLISSNAAKMNKAAVCHAKDKLVCSCSSLPDSVLLPGNNNHSSRKSLEDSVLQAPMGSWRVTVCYGLMSHNNGNLWFTLFDSLFYVSSTLNGSGLRYSPLASHIYTHTHLSIYFIALYGLSHLTLPFGHIKHPPQVTQAQEPNQETRGSFNPTDLSNKIRALLECTNTHLLYYQELHAAATEVV